MSESGFSFRTAGVYEDRGVTLAIYDIIGARKRGLFQSLQASSGLFLVQTSNVDRYKEIVGMIHGRLGPSYELDQ